MRANPHTDRETIYDTRLAHMSRRNPQPRSCHHDDAMFSSLMGSDLCNLMHFGDFFCLETMGASRDHCPSAGVTICRLRSVLEDDVDPLEWTE